MKIKINGMEIELFYGATLKHALLKTNEEMIVFPTNSLFRCNHTLAYSQRPLLVFIYQFDTKNLQKHQINSAPNLCFQDKSIS